MTKKSGNAEPKGGAHQQDLPLTWGEGQAAGAADVVPADSADIDAAPAGPAAAQAAADAVPEMELKPSLARSPDDATPALQDEAPGPIKVVELGQVEMTLGQALLDARGTRNLAVAQVSQKTHIPKQIIEQFETDQFQALPAPVYARSHISQLCREYSIEPKPLLDMYERMAAEAASRSGTGGLIVASEQTESGSKVVYHPEPEGGVTAPRRPFTVTTLLLRGAILVLVLLVIVALAIGKARRMRSGAGGSGSGNAEPLSADINLEDFIIPQELPPTELPIPED